jgi:hypothetical protein
VGRSSRMSMSGVGQAFGRNAAAATCAAPAFASPRYVPIAARSFPYGFARADFDGDGHLDLAAIYGRFPGQHLHVLRGDGSGGFITTATALPPNLSIMFLHAAEVTGDTNVDLVTTAYDGSAQSGYVIVLEGDGGGGFAPRLPLPLVGSGGANDLDLADVDGDGDLDVVVITIAIDFSGTVTTLMNDGSGGFGPPVNGPAGLYPNGITAADFNGDDHVDVALAVYELGDATAPGRVEIRLGDGTGAFGPVLSSHLVRAPYRIQPGDFDEDGDLDVAVGTAPPNERGTMTVLFGDGTGRLSTPLVLDTVTGLYEVVVADFTGDGHLDLAGSGACYIPARQVYVSALAIFPGSGAGTFGAPTLLYPQSDGGAFMPAAGDFDEDGRLDIAAAGEGPQSGARVALFLSMCGNIADLALSIADSPDPVGSISSRRNAARRIADVLPVAEHGVAFRRARRFPAARRIAIFGDPRMESVQRS